MLQEVILEEIIDSWGSKRFNFKRWVFKRSPLYEGTAYILVKKRTNMD